MRKYAKMILTFILMGAMYIAGLPVAEGETKLQIVCSSFPCYDFARAIAGDLAEIRLLIKPGAEVHSYEPSPTDVLEVGECDLFLYIGGESDVWVDSILDAFGEQGPQSLRLIEYAELLEEAEEAQEAHAHEQEHAYDEHIWTDPANAKRMLAAISDKLCTLFPELEQTFRANAERYAAQISNIDEEIKDVVAHAKRKLLIFADRFPFLYFVTAYGLDYMAAYPGCSAESEPSAHTMVALIDRVRQDQIPAVYVLEFSNGRIAATISEETGAEVLTMQSLQNVTLEDFENGETYISLMTRNVDALRKGLN